MTAATGAPLDMATGVGVEAAADAADGDAVDMLWWTSGGYK